MRTVHCPLCGLRYAHASELDVHVREDHAPAAQQEGQEVIPVPARHKPAQKTPQ